MIDRIKTSPTGGTRARGSQEPSKRFATIAFFLPLILAGAYLNMGQTCCSCPPTPANFVVTDSTAGEIADDDSWNGVASSDGMLLMFTSQADNLGAPSDGALVDLFAHDVSANETTWVGAASSTFFFSPALNAAGDYAVFGVLDPAYAGYQVGGLNTSGSDHTIDWIFTNNGSLDPEPTLSGDGRYVAFNTNWAGPGDTNGLVDIYIRDRQTWGLSQVDRPSGSQYNLPADSPKLARYADRLVYQLGDQWVHYTDWQCVPSVFVSCSETFAGTRPSISDDGTKVAYQASDGGYDGIFLFEETTDTHQRVSIDAYGRPASAECDYPVISGNGQFVAFRCAEAMTSHGGTNQVYVRDLNAGTTKLASITSTSVPANQGAIPSSLSYGGVSLLLESTSTNLGSITAGTRQVFRIPITYWREGDTCLPSSSVDTTCDQIDDDCDGEVDDDYDDVAEQTTCGINQCASGAFVCIHGIEYDTCNSDCIGGDSQLVNFTVSKAADGVPGDAASWQPVASADGNVIAFSSLATNLDPGADGLAPGYDIFVHDVASAQTTWANDGTYGGVGGHSISANGRYVAFYGPESSFWRTSLYIRDLETPGAVLETHDVSGSIEDVAISGDGRYVLFLAPRSRIWNGGWVYLGEGLVVLDRITGQRTEVPYLLGGNRDSIRYPSITPDGFWVTYQIYVPNPAPPAWPHTRTVVASHQTGELYASILGVAPSISDDGRFIAVHRRKIVQGEWDLLPNGVHVHDRITGIDVEASVPAFGDSSGDSCGGPIISGNGQFVAFSCVESMTSHGAERQVYVRDLINETTRLASVHPNGEPADAPAYVSSITSDGSAVTILSAASNLGIVSGEHSQVFRIPSSHWQP